MNIDVMSHVHEDDEISAQPTISAEDEYTTVRIGDLCIFMTNDQALILIDKIKESLGEAK